MSAEWNIIGQVGDITKYGGMYAVNIADNRFHAGKKVKTIWFNCLCRFKPRVKKGDRVLARGHFDESKNEGFQYAMMMDHIGVINEDSAIYDRNGESDENPTEPKKAIVQGFSDVTGMLDKMTESELGTFIPWIFNEKNDEFKDTRDQIETWGKLKGIDIEKYKTNNNAV